MERPQYIYDIDDRPPLKLTVIYALQWAMIIFPAILPFAIIPARVLNLGSGEEVRFLQLTLLVTGFFTSVQCLWGHRYPVIDGPSTALLLTFLVIAPYGLPAVQAGAVLGGLLLMVAVLIIKPGRIIAVMTPNVVGVILMLIGLNLLPYLSPLMTGTGSPEGGSASRLVLSLALILIMATVAYKLRGFLKSIWLLLGMTIGSALFFLIEHPTLENLLSADWFSYPARIVPSRPEFALSSLIAFAVSYVAVVVNSVGSIQAIANITSDERLPRALPRCLFLNGIAGVVCGAMGITGMVSYSMSPGIVLSNRVASRYAVACCGVMVMLAAFMPKLSALFALVPAPVVGATLCTAMGFQVGAAFAIIAQGGIDQRSYYVVGLPILVGTMIGFLPQEIVQQVPAIFRVFLGNGLTFGILFVLVLEHVLMRGKPAVKGGGGK